MHNINGNIDTRIKKLNDGIYDCIILAIAGCHRLGLELNSIVLDKHMTLPSQGMICVQTNTHKITRNYLVDSKGYLSLDLTKLIKQIKQERS